MAEYHFVSTWQIQAPIERVWEEIYHAERWPAWWKYVTGVDELEPGAADGVGKRLRLLFRTRLPRRRLWQAPRSPATAPRCMWSLTWTLVRTGCRRYRPTP